MNERWRPIAGYEGRYEVSDRGRVRSVRRTCRAETWRSVPARILKPEVNPHDNHHRVRLFDGNGIRHSRRFQVHILVLEAFVGPRPEGKLGCHWDDDPSNNWLENLRWATHADNIADRTRNRDTVAIRRAAVKPRRRKATA